MNDETTRLYAQLRPVGDSLAHLLWVQQHVPKRGRLTAPERIHLTLIHFGKVAAALNGLPNSVRKRSASEQRQALLRYVESSRRELSLAPQAFTLRPSELKLFGEYGRTLVITYEPTDELCTLHEKLLGHLRQFFIDCGVTDPDKHMGRDPNFKHALSLHPHITLMKGYDGKLPLIRQSRLEPVTLRLMPFEYDEAGSLEIPEF